MDLLHLLLYFVKLYYTYFIYTLFKIYWTPEMISRYKYILYILCPRRTFLKRMFKTVKLVILIQLMN